MGKIRAQEGQKHYLPDPKDTLETQYLTQQTAAMTSGDH